ncbi:MAG: 50S ribosomal protein L4 [Nanoarchaeota archaeon]|nr:50S ribosomal protein L4 [Nanoarchaeota archaeon]MBU4086587.1 50S ribosomal protein L4 [Nanoarchaeota archaeon]
MKSKIISESGTSGEIDMPEFFSMLIREDIAQKFYESQKQIQPYAPFIMAGKQHSASGILSHSRRLWKTAYGKGISRVPRKIFWRRGDHFYWQGAEVSGTRGGRKPHPPKVLGFQTKKKINKKEAVIALQSVMAATARLDILKKRYSSAESWKLELPLVIKSDLLKLKTKQFFEILKNNLNSAWESVLQKKEVRAGKGKMRNRKYKKSAGLLLIIGKDEKANFSGIDVRKIDEIEMADLWPMGRLTIYSEQAVKELKQIGENKK